MKKGDIVSHYKIIEKLGRGGMGDVFKAEDTNLKRIVALKFLSPELTRDSLAESRFIREAQAASSLEHNNICNIHEIDKTAEGKLFVVMACYEGETLKERIERSPINITETLEIALQVCQGLKKAHGKDIVHRDIKPSNIFITSEGTVKIIDFGLAKLTGRTMLTVDNSTAGTVSFMSPEQVKGETVDRRTDVWALGIVIYNMITGLLPFCGDYDQAILYSILNQDPEPVTALRKGIPLELDRIVSKSLAKNPGERYQHVDEMLVDLRNLKDNLIPSLRSKTATSTLPKMSGRKRKIFLTGATGIVLAVLIFLGRSFFKSEVIVSEPKPIAVITFENQTGDKSFDYLRKAIPNLLITSLEQSKYLKVMTWERMRDVLKQMGKKDVDNIDKNLGFELCRFEGINAVVTGSFIKAGGTFATDIKVLDVETKELVKSASARGRGVQSILDDQIDKLSKEIATGVGLSPNHIEENSAQISEVTTSSMDAYNYFLRGRDEYERFYYPVAIRFLERATSLDSSFAMAYFYLSRSYGALLERSKAYRTLLRAKELSARAPEKERLAIESRYAEIVENNPSKSFILLKELVKKYPDEKIFHDDLAYSLLNMNMLSEAESEFKKAIKLDPDYALPQNGLGYLYAAQFRYKDAVKALQKYALLSPGDANPFDSMGAIYILMGDLDQSLLKFKQAVKLEPLFYNTYINIAYIYCLKDDYESCFKWIDSLLNIVPNKGLLANARAWRSLFLRLTGRYREANGEIKLMGKLVNQMKNEAGYRNMSGPYYWIKGWNSLITGEITNAKKVFDEYDKNNKIAHPQSPIFNKEVSLLHRTYIYLYGGHTDSARSTFEEMRPDINRVEWNKKNFRMQSGILESEICLAEGKPDEAIRIYRSTPVPGPTMNVGWQMPMNNIPSLRDVVPRAFIIKGEPDSAITEYIKMFKIDPNNLDRRIINPLYHYRLAKLYEQTGQVDKAVSEYRLFLKLWKNADKDRRELIEAGKRLRNILSRMKAA